MRRIDDDLHDGSAREVIFPRQPGNDVPNRKVQRRGRGGGALIPRHECSAGAHEIVESTDAQAILGALVCRIHHPTRSPGTSAPSATSAAAQAL